MGTPDGIQVPMDGILAETSAEPFFTFTGAKFPESSWDPHLRAQVILAEFGKTNWRDYPPPNPPKQAVEIAADITAVFQWRVERPNRTAEIIAQAQNLELYWSDMLMVGPVGRPYTATLIAVGMAVGQMVGMHWKHHFKRARPVQFFPAVMPVILTPPHPSFPNNHSFQSHLIAHTVQAAFKEPVAGAMRVQLMALADRIGVNREIAGVHFPTDTDAGKQLAKDIFPLLAGLSSFREVCEAAKAEWPGLGVGPQP
jgi:membrane-associated phospholipid phosphatase